MGKKEKINNFKSIVGIKDNSIAEKYLIRANWDENAAIDLYFKENKNIKKNNNNQKIKPVIGKCEFEISETLYESEEVFIQKDKDAYIDLFKFLEGKFYVSQNFEEFLSSLKKKAGLIIIFPKEKMTEVRNNMIRASNNVICLDILKQSSIFPIMKDTQTGNEFINKLFPKNYPVYLFCKYKNSKVMTINAMVEKKFRMDNVINNLLDSFPDNDVKQSVYKSINNSIINFKNEPKKDEDFTGDENEINTLIRKIKTDTNIMETLFKQNNINKDNVDKPFKQENEEEPKNNNNKGNNNRFQNMFENDKTTILINNDKNVKGNQFNLESFLESNIKEINNIQIEENNIPKEPDERDPNACTIAFRYPYGEKQIKRRFNKTDKIEVLFNYVKSLGREIYSKPIYNNFELIYGFPPINFETKRDNTLDEEGLFPSSMINIIEK